MTIHHATAKKAEKLGFEIIETDGLFHVVVDVDEDISTKPQASAKEALEEATRIRDLIDAGEYDEDEEKVTSSIVKTKYRQMYKERGDANCCGDDMSAEFKNFVTVQNAKGKDELDMSALRHVARDNDLEEKLDEWLNKGLNNGQCRMNLGNMFRKRFRDGEPIQFGSFTMTPEFDDAGNLI